jgi:hypothetical protein
MLCRLGYACVRACVRYVGCCWRSAPRHIYRQAHDDFQKQKQGDGLGVLACFAVRDEYRNVLPFFFFSLFDYVPSVVGSVDLVQNEPIQSAQPHNLK